MGTQQQISTTQNMPSTTNTKNGFTYSPGIKDELLKEKSHHYSRNRIGNPIGFDISVLSKFKKIKGEYGAKFMVKRLKKKTNFIKVTSSKIFKDLDVKKDFS